MSTPAGSFNYSFNGRGDLTGLTNPFQESFAWSYQDNGWLQSRQVGNAATTTYAYNGLGQLLDLANHKGSATGTILSEFSAVGAGHYDGAGDLLVTMSIVNHIAIFSTIFFVLGPGLFIDGFNIYYGFKPSKIHPDGSARPSLVGCVPIIFYSAFSIVLFLILRKHYPTIYIPVSLSTLAALSILHIFSLIVPRAIVRRLCRENSETGSR